MQSQPEADGLEFSFLPALGVGRHGPLNLGSLTSRPTHDDGTGTGVMTHRFTGQFLQRAGNVAGAQKRGCCDKDPGRKRRRPGTRPAPCRTCRPSRRVLPCPTLFYNSFEVLPFTLHVSTFSYFLSFPFGLFRMFFSNL